MNGPNRVNRSPLRSADVPAIGGASLALALCASLLSTPALADPPRSSFAESRGYQACVDGAGRQAQLVTVDSNYFTYRHDNARRLYLNGYAFIDGDSVPVKIACDTTLSGHRLLDVSVDAGEYAGRLVQPVNVAGN